MLVKRSTWIASADLHSPPVSVLSTPSSFLTSTSLLGSELGYPLLILDKFKAQLLSLNDDALTACEAAG
jgi:hypothetical protein